PKTETVTETIEPLEEEKKKEEEKSEREAVSKPPDLPETEPEKKQEAPTKEKEDVSQDTRLVEAIGNLNRGIRYYFEGNRSESKEYLREALRVFPGESKHDKGLVTTYQFLAVVLIENHYLTGDPTGQLLQQAREYINKIRKLEPGFRLEANYFSPKVVKVFSDGN
ncbi:MAG: hypothetical protein GY950_33660, partial [bacterium]|nr:hypothetical protein [bacterium]